LNILTNVLKAVVAVAAAPVVVIADLATLPASAHAGRGPFERTGGVLRTAGKALDAAIRPEIKDAP
jgi:hypothetical protein